MYESSEEIREEIANTIAAVKSGEMDPRDARIIIAGIREYVREQALELEAMRSKRVQNNGGVVAAFKQPSARRLKKVDKAG